LRAHHFVEKFLGDREAAFIRCRSAAGRSRWRGRAGGGRGRGRRRGLSFGHGIKLGDQFGILALGLGPFFLEFAQQRTDAVDAFEDEGHRLRRYRQHAVAEFAENVFARVGDRFEPGQTEEAAGALDRMHQTKNVAKDGGVAWILFEFDEFDVENRKAFAGFG
jgi:hypothetical protein